MVKLQYYSTSELYRLLDKVESELSRREARRFGEIPADIVEKGRRRRERMKAITAGRIGYVADSTERTVMEMVFKEDNSDWYYDRVDAEMDVVQLYSGRIERGYFGY